MKIFDCVPYFDENMMLDLRFNILNEHVFKFIIVEQLYTHSGEKKKQNFDINNFKKFKDKIEYFLIENEPKDLHKIDTNDTNYLGLQRLNSLKRINIQYNKLKQGIHDADDNDLIMVSDCDEIPNMQNLNLKNFTNEIILFKQKIFYYKFNLLHENINWYGTKACRKKNLKSFEWLKYIKNKKYSFWRLDTLLSNNKYINVDIINEGGWHFTNIKNYKDVYYKLQNYGEHNEFEKSGLTTSDINNLIENKELYFNHTLDKTDPNKYSSKIKLKKINDDILPNFLVNNKQNYSEWFD
ncbi:hypothetical protein N9T29_01700 [Candidatus Pelagibacter sp.]|nr:hypothetical protein [Candidatus Pelagibacter sp.]